MGLNYIGIVGGVLAFISIALPWWTFTMSVSAMGISYSFDMSAYLYQVTANSNIPYFPGGTAPADVWWCQVALALVIIGGLLGIIGSITAFGKYLLVGGGALTLLSAIIFAVGLQGDLAKITGITSMIPGISIGLFSGGSLNFMGATLNYSTYLSFGFWLALVAAIVMFVAMKKAEEIAPTPTPVAAPPP